MKYAFPQSTEKRIRDILKGHSEERILNALKVCSDCWVKGQVNMQYFIFLYESGIPCTVYTNGVWKTW